MTTATPTGAPAWRPLAGLAALVVLAHALLLSASPPQLGTGSDPDAAGSKTFSTRNIEPAPPAMAEAAKPATPSVRAKRPPEPPKKLSNESVAQSIPVQAAIDSVATDLTSVQSRESLHHIF